LGTAALLPAEAVVPLGAVQVKMLPFDNGRDVQVLINMPEGTPLERSTAVIRALAAAVREEPEILDYQIYAGTAAPCNFNGLVRHYFQRGGGHQADLQLNLRPRHERQADSHTIAKRLRPRLAAIAAEAGGRVTDAEVPPGPPVLQTLVAEVYGPNPEAQLRLAGELRNIFVRTHGVVDVD
jgi:multidrug efflux pump subunit AcrB